MNIKLNKNNIKNILPLTSAGKNVYLMAIWAYGSQGSDVISLDKYALQDYQKVTSLYGGGFNTTSLYRGISSLIDSGLIQQTDKVGQYRITSKFIG